MHMCQVYFLTGFDGVYKRGRTEGVTWREVELFEIN